MLTVKQPRHDDVAALDETHVFRGGATDAAVENLRHPRTGGVDQHTSGHSSRAPLDRSTSVAIIGRPPAGPPPAGFQPDPSAALLGVQSVQDDETRVVDGAIGIGESRPSSPGLSGALRWRVPWPRLIRSQPARGLTARKVIIEKQAQAKPSKPAEIASCRGGRTKPQGMDDVRGEEHQPARVSCSASRTSRNSKYSR